MVDHGSPAVRGSLKVLLEEAVLRYTELGCLPEAQGWAYRDAEESVKYVEIFLDHHGLPALTNRKHIVEVYASMWLSGVFVKWMKWATAVPMADLTGLIGNADMPYRELPPFPAGLDEGMRWWSVFVPGQPLTQRSLRARTKEKNSVGGASQRALRLCWSLLGTKGFFPSMWPDQILPSLRDHSEALGMPAPPLDERAYEALDVAASTVERSFWISGLVEPRQELVRYSELPKPRLSAKSGFVKEFDSETSRFRSGFGTRSAQYHKLGGHQAEELLSMSYHPRVGVSQHRGIPYQFDWRDYDYDPKVSIVALQEPLKIRTISVADGPSMAAGTPIQKLLHSTMRRLKVFELIGGVPVDESVQPLLALFGVQYTDPADMFWGEEIQSGFVSGDYSAATDGLNMNASVYVFNILTKRIVFPPGLKERLLQSLTASIMDYSQTLEQFKDQLPEPLYEYLQALLPPSTQQKNGQLMGNILSFPILCIINFATWIDANRNGVHQDIVNRAFRRGFFTVAELESLPLRLNGDDILFHASRDVYDEWRSRLPVYGFKPSLGKNYFSNQFFTVNSQLFSRSGRVLRPEWSAFQTDYYRLRKQSLRLGEDVVPSDPRTVLPRIQDQLRASVPESDFPGLNRAWIRCTSDLLVESFPGLNWFLPLDHGGLGLNARGCHYDVTYAQKKLAIRASRDPEGFSRLLPRVENSLTTADDRKVFRKSFPTMYMSGEVFERNGLKMVLDKDQPIQLRLQTGVVPITSGGTETGVEPVVMSEDLRVEFLGSRVFYHGYPLVSALEALTTKISTWLDFNVSGQRFDLSTTGRVASRLLSWGCGISDRYLPDFDNLPSKPRFLCTTVRRLEVISL